MSTFAIWRRVFLGERVVGESRLDRTYDMQRLLPAAALLFIFAAPGAAAGAYDFVPAPQTDLNRLYRIERITGEVGACQYGLKEGSVGATLCFGAGEGAGPQPPGEYALVSSRHEREGGVFRVNLRTGEMSVCYVFEDSVVCTPPEKVSARSETANAAATPDTTGGFRD